MLATLIRLLGSFDVAEEAMHDAFTAALDSWPQDGVPENPRAWLISTGRFKAIDRLRRGARFDAALTAAADQLEASAPPAPDFDEEGLEDDRLRLIFTCCHPALTADARIALTLREVCGLETEEIARAFLIPAPTLAQRIVRAKGKSATRKSPIRFRREPNFPTGSTRCCTSSTSFSMKVTRHRQASRSLGTIFLPRPSGWGGS